MTAQAGIHLPQLRDRFGRWCRPCGHVAVALLAPDLGDADVGTMRRIDVAGVARDLRPAQWTGSSEHADLRLARVRHAARAELRPHVTAEAIADSRHPCMLGALGAGVTLDAAQPLAIEIEGEMQGVVERDRLLGNARRATARDEHEHEQAEACPVHGPSPNG